MGVILGWLLQVLILATGIFFFLRLVRTTRGSRIIRGLVLAIVVGFLGLWGLSEAFALEELGHIIQGVSGFVVVIFAILFQPELRRGIAQLGEGPLLGRIMRGLGKDTISEVCQAVVTMAARRQGALIAIERENPLAPWVEGGVGVDGTVNRLLLESLFHPGSTLHDGAVVIKKDRIAAASCLFPLTENLEVSRSMGTRHRAALGLTDETDAITIAVSEETGDISICKAGAIRSKIPPSKLEETLRAVLGSERALAHPPEPPRRVTRSQALVRFLRGDLMWIGAALVLAIGTFVLAHQALMGTVKRELRVVWAKPGEAPVPSAGELVVVLPSADYRPMAMRGVTRPLFEVDVRGTRGQLNEVRLRGVLRLSEPIESPIAVPIDAIQWRQSLPGMSHEWAAAEVPALWIERFEQRSAELSPDNLAVDAAGLDARFGARIEAASFEPNPVQVVGPSREFARLGSAELPLVLAPIALAREEPTDFRVRVRLAPELEALGFSLAHGDVLVSLPIVPAESELDPVTMEVSLVCMDPKRRGELARWAIPSQSQTVRVRVWTSGVMPASADASSPVVIQLRAAIRDIVTQNLRMFVDVSDLPPEGEGRTVRVEHRWARDWNEALGQLGFGIGAGAALEVELFESDRTILLEEASGGS